MRFLRLLPAFLVTLVVAWGVAAQQPQGAAPGAGGPPRPPFVITVDGLTDGGDFPLEHSAAGAMTTPAISWTGAPANTVTFLIHMHDMDNSRNKTTDDQLHWLVWDIPGTATGLPGSVPMGNPLADGAFQTSATGVGTYRPPGFAGNGPKHHYTIELFALDTKIDVQPGPMPFDTWAAVDMAMQGHIIGKAMIMGLFKRPPAPAGAAPAAR